MADYERCDCALTVCPPCKDEAAKRQAYWQAQHEREKEARDLVARHRDHLDPLFDGDVRKALTLVLELSAQTFLQHQRFAAMDR